MGQGAESLPAIFGKHRGLANRPRGDVVHASTSSPIKSLISLSRHNSTTARRRRISSCKPWCCGRSVWPTVVALPPYPFLNLMSATGMTKSVSRVVIDTFRESY